MGKKHPPRDYVPSSIPDFQHYVLDAITNLYTIRDDLFHSAMSVTKYLDSDPDRFQGWEEVSRKGGHTIDSVKAHVGHVLKDLHEQNVLERIWAVKAIGARHPLYRAKDPKYGISPTGSAERRGQVIDILERLSGETDNDTFFGAARIAEELPEKKLDGSIVFKAMSQGAIDRSLNELETMGLVSVVRYPLGDGHSCVYRVWTQGKPKEARKGVTGDRNE